MHYSHYIYVHMFPSIYIFVYTYNDDQNIAVYIPIRWVNIVLMTYSLGSDLIALKKNSLVCAIKFT